MPAAPHRRRGIAVATLLVSSSVLALAVGSVWLASPSEPGRPPAAAPTSSSAVGPPSSTGGPTAGPVCADFARLYLAANTRTDTGPGAARRRAAARYGTPELVQRLSTPAATTTSSRWRRWARHQARITVDIGRYVGEAPPSAPPGTAYRAVRAERTAHGSGSWHKRLPSLTVYCTLARSPTGTWRVDAVSTSLHAGNPS